MPNLLLVLIGGAFGAGLRYEVGRLSLRALGHGFPWGTLTVNLVGGLLMGLLAGTLARTGANEQLRLFIAVGLLGGFTTFSAFSLETFTMIQRGDVATAALYASASVVGSVLLLFAGLMMTRLAL
jgi:CrcB protein